MRRILFRAKRMDDGEWVEGYLMCVSGMTFMSVMGIVSPMPVDIDTVGQYTGLTDKNGEKLFEGDIVLKKHIGYIPIEDVGQVSFDDGMFVFESKAWGGIYKLPLSLKEHVENDMGAIIKIKYEYERLGNIYDNPELLRDGDE